MATDDSIEAQIASGAYDFIDFGCSKGNSLKFGFERLGAVRGIGLDKDPRKVEATRSLGYEAVELDIAALQAYKNSVSFVLMFHFLEHLPGYRVARSCIVSGLAAARDYVFIKQPWFDSDSWLFDQGVKFYWSDWRGHDYCMDRLQLMRAIRDSGVSCRYRMYGRRPVTTTDDLAIHPLASPFDQHAYNRALHGPKPVVDVTVPTYYELQCLLLLSDRYSFSDLEGNLDGGAENVLFEGRLEA